MAKNMFNEETGHFKTNESTTTQKEAKINAKTSVPWLEVAGKSKMLSNKAFSIGRDRSNQIIIADTKVSRFHAMIKFKNEEVYIKDTNSSNGTYINGKKITPDKSIKLKNGDKIKVGTTVLVFYK